MPTYHDEELGPTPVRPSRETFPIYVLAVVIGLASGLGILAIYFHSLAHHSDKTEIRK